MKKICASIFLSLFFLYLILCPDSAISGVRDGLLLWYRSVLPTLFPFLFLCSLLLKLDLLAPILPAVFYPLHALFGCTRYGALAILTGFFCGFPMGAKITHDLELDEKINVKEAAWLSGFVNNLSPGFLLSYLAYDQMNLPSWNLFFLSNILGASLLYGLITSFSMRRFFTNEKNSIRHPSSCTQGGSRQKLYSQIDDCIHDSVKNTVRLCVYITLFSILKNALALLLPKETIFALLLRSSIEVTGGIQLIASSSLSFSLKFILVNALCTFGGVCALVQTAGIAEMNLHALIQYAKSRVAATLLSIVLSCISLLVLFCFF